MYVQFVRHLLIAFGGLAGLEESIEEDSNLKVLLYWNIHCHCWKSYHSVLFSFSFFLGCVEGHNTSHIYAAYTWFKPVWWHMIKLLVANLRLIQHIFVWELPIEYWFWHFFFFKGKNVREVFDSYLNTCPHQGSRTIRTEVWLFDWLLVYVSR